MASSGPTMLGGMVMPDCVRAGSPPRRLELELREVRFPQLNSWPTMSGNAPLFAGPAEHDGAIIAARVFTVRTPLAVVAFGNRRSIDGRSCAWFGKWLRMRLTPFEAYHRGPFLIAGDWLGWLTPPTIEERDRRSDAFARITECSTRASMA
jgi:hypothetical protein